MAEAGLPTPFARVSLCQALTASAPVSGFTCTNTKTTPNAMDSWHNPEQTEVPRLISLLDLSERETVATSQQDRVESERRYEAQEQRSTPTKEWPGGCDKVPPRGLPGAPRWLATVGKIL